MKRPIHYLKLLLNTILIVLSIYVTFFYVGIQIDHKMGFTTSRDIFHIVPNIPINSYTIVTSLLAMVASWFLTIVTPSILWDNDKNI